MQYQDESEPANTRQNMFNLTLRLWAQKTEQTQRAHGIDKSAAGFYQSLLLIERAKGWVITLELKVAQL